MPTERIEPELIAYEPEEPFEALAHVHRFGGNIDLCRRTQAEHLHRLGYPGQTRQFRIRKSPPGFDSPSVAEHQHKSAICTSRRFHVYLDQPLLPDAMCSKVAAQRAQGYPCLLA